MGDEGVYWFGVPENDRDVYLLNLNNHHGLPHADLPFQPNHNELQMILKYPLTY